MGRNPVKWIKLFVNKNLFYRQQENCCSLTLSTTNWRKLCLSTSKKSIWSIISFLRYFNLKNPATWLAESILAHNLRTRILADKVLAVKNKWQNDLPVFLQIPIDTSFSCKDRQAWIYMTLPTRARAPKGLKWQFWIFRINSYYVQNVWI